MWSLRATQVSRQRVERRLGPSYQSDRMSSMHEIHIQIPVLSEKYLSFKCFLSNTYKNYINPLKWKFILLFLIIANDKEM